MLPTAVANPRAKTKNNRIVMSKELIEAKKNGASKEELKKLRMKLKNEARVAKAAGVSLDLLKQAQARGASIDEIKAKVNMHNLKKRKVKGMFKKKEASISDILFPGASPNEFRAGDSILISAETVTSTKTQIPFDYYKMPVCRPSQIKYKHKRQNLGERLGGNGISRVSPYDINLLRDQQCTSLCTVNFDRKMIKRMRKLIKREYVANLSLDSLPVNVPRKSGSVIRGYPLGSKLINEATDVTDYVLHNHLKFVIQYNDAETEPGFVRIVGFSVKPVSITHDPDELKSTCGEDDVVSSKNSLLHLNIENQSLPVTYSFDVSWIESDLSWTDRWDVYLLGAPDDALAHHMSLLNSFMVVIFLITCIAMILIKALRKDIAIYNETGISLDDGTDQDESGWKMIHGDVFRPPSFSPMGLSVLVGTGAQLAIAMIGTLLLSQTKMLNPTMKGQALTNIVLVFVFSGTVSGYLASRIFKLFGGKNWKLNTLLTASCFPGTLMGLFLVLNIMLAINGSAKTVSLFTIICAFFLWVGVATPLVFIGSFFGFKRDVIEVPTRTNQIARVVPEKNNFVSSDVSSIFIGALPFSCACIEIYFLMGAIWMHQYYYLMGYLLAISVLLGASSALISIIVCYIRLNGEDHRWWWKAFTDTASMGCWLFSYSIWYLCFRLALVGVLPIMVYLTYMAMASVAVGLYCGSLSFLSTFWFTRTIYGAVKLD